MLIVSRRKGQQLRLTNRVTGEQITLTMIQVFRDEHSQSRIGVDANLDWFIARPEQDERLGGALRITNGEATDA